MLALFAVLLGVTLLAHTAPFPFLLEPFRPARSLWQMQHRPGAPPTIYLTFDDGPNPEWTPQVLDALQETRARGTFFLIDEHINAETAPIVRRIAAEGHAIGLHTGDRWMAMMEPEEIAGKLHHAYGRITAITGTEPCRLFRPHAGRLDVVGEDLGDPAAAGGGRSCGCPSSPSSPITAPTCSS